MTFPRSFAFMLAPLFVAACSTPQPVTDAGSEGEGEGEPACTEPATVECVDESIQQLAMKENPAPGDIEEIEGSPDFVHEIDASGGGLNPTDSYVYAKFTDDGLAKVDVGDEEAFESMDWDIAFRRFIIRLNSGVSGPSCVSAARTSGGTEFDEATVESDLNFHTEEYFDAEASCAFVADGSGLGSPGVVMQNFWEYPGCVKMTGNVYVIELASGQHVKVQVLQYYGQGQAGCDEDSTAGTQSGTVRVKWAFLD